MPSTKHYISGDRTVIIRPVEQLDKAELMRLGLITYGKTAWGLICYEQDADGKLQPEACVSLRDEWNKTMEHIFQSASGSLGRDIMIYVALDSQDGIVGFTIWVLDTAPEDEMKFESDSTPGTKTQYADQIRKQSTKAIQVNMNAAQSYWDTKAPVYMEFKTKLSHLVVIPAYQYEGIDSALIRQGLEAAFQWGFPIFVTSTERAKSPYEACGFQVCYPRPLGLLDNEGRTYQFMIKNL